MHHGRTLGRAPFCAFYVAEEGAVDAGNHGRRTNRRRKRFRRVAWHPDISVGGPRAGMAVVAAGTRCPGTSAGEPRAGLVVVTARRSSWFQGEVAGAWALKLSLRSRAQIEAGSQAHGIGCRERYIYRPSRPSGFL
jgi:hypothetical protein